MEKWKFCYSAAYFGNNVLSNKQFRKVPFLGGLKMYAEDRFLT